MAEQGKVEEAIASYETAVRLEPDNVDALNNLGVALARQGNRQAATSLWIMAWFPAADTTPLTMLRL